MTYQLGIDLGTTYTAAAVYRDGRAAIVTLGDRAAAIPSAVFLKEDETILTGDAASRRAMSEPGRIAREFKRRLGDPTPILLGGSPYSAESLMAKLLRWVVDKVTELEGGPPSHIAVSHPANWGPYKKDLLDQAVRMADLEHVTTVTEPEAAAICYASNERIEAGSVVAVYDLGGGTFDAAVLRKAATGWEILGQPEGIERLGGIDFDQAVFSHVRTALAGKIEELDLDDPSAIAAVARLRDDCISAKEALSSDTDATVPVLLPNVSTEVRINRGELESLIRPTLQDTVGALRRALRSAGVEPDEVTTVLLVGGSSRIPLVAQLMSAELGRPVAVDAHPKHSIALGAAIAAATEVHGSDVTAVATAAEVATDVVPAEPPAAVADVAPPQAPPAPPGPGARTKRKVPVAAVAVVVALLAVAGGAFALGGGGGDDDDAGGESAGTTSTTATTVVASGLGDGSFAASEPPVALMGDVRVETRDGSPRYIFDVEPVDFTLMAISNGPRTGDYEVHLFWNSIEPEAAFDEDGVGNTSHFHDWIPVAHPSPVGTVDNQLFNVSARPEGATMICSVLGLGLRSPPDVDGDGDLDYQVDCAALPSGDVATATTVTPGGTAGTNLAASMVSVAASTEAERWHIRWRTIPSDVYGKGLHLHFYWAGPDTMPIWATASAEQPIGYAEWHGTTVAGDMPGREDDAGNGESISDVFGVGGGPPGAMKICLVVVNADHTAYNMNGDREADISSCQPVPA